MATRDIGNLRTRLSWEDEGSTRSLTRFKDDLRGLRSEMRTITSQGKDYTNSMKGLRQQSDILSRQLKTQQNRVRELRKRYEESRRVKGEDAKQTRNLSTQYNNAVAEMNRMESQLDRVTQAIREQENPWKRLSKSMTDAGDKMQTVGRSMSSFGREYTMKVTAPIVAGGTAAFKAAMDFESAFAGVEKTFGGTSEQLADLRVGIREMAKEIPASTTEIASVAEAAGQLGIEAESVEEFTRTMIDLGEATNLSAEQAATEFARFANIVGMSQDDFDKLGSSVVALGNNMATTESEISSMAMRLAAQGSQVGMTEAQIMALSATMSSLGIEAEAGGTAMSTVLKKIDAAVGESGEELEAFAKAAGVSSSEFAKVWEEEPVKALDLFIKGLSESGEEGENLTTILGELGIKGIRESDTILRLAGASDLLTEAVETSTNAWGENSALTDEAAQRYATTESQLKILWNRMKDVAITLGEALIPAVMDAIDAVAPLIRKIEEGAQAFSDMTEEEQQSILKMIGLVAAIGPATVALGGLTTGIGGVLKVGGSLVGLLGKVGGAGLLGKIGLMGAGSATPVGLAIAGIAGLTFGIYALNKANQENLEETTKAIEKRKEELDSLDESIARFDELQRKNQLTTDEVLRYMDIMDELKEAKNEETIAALTEEQADLLEKSGMTNDEIEEFLKLNDIIVEKTPGTAQAISEQGNAYAETTDKVKELTRVERERLTGQTYEAITAEMHEQERNLDKQKQLQDEIAGLESDREKHNDNILDKTYELQEQDLVIADLRERIKNAVGEEKDELILKLRQEQLSRDGLEQDIGLEQEKIDKIDQQIGKKEDSLTKTEKELELFQSLLDDYAQMILHEQGIVSEKGKAVETLQQEQQEIDTARAKLQELWDQQKISRSEYEAQNQKLDEQQGKIDVATGKLEEMNTVAGRTVYKDVEVDVDPSITSINRELSSGVRKQVSVFTALDGNYRRLSDPTAKTVNIRTVGGHHVEPGYATGTNYHPGGGFIAGEQGYELGRLGDKWEFLNFGRYERPSGYEVFTHDESKKILNAMNRLPAYAEGARPSGEADRIINRMNNSMSDANGQVVALLRDIAQGVREGKVVQISSHAVTDAVNETNAVNDLGNYF